MHTISLLGIEMAHTSYSNFLALLKDPKENSLVFTPNPEILLRASKDPIFHALLKKATYNVPDGFGVYVGYMVLEGYSFWKAAWMTLVHKSSCREKYGDIIKGSDLTKDIISACQNTGKPILIIDKRVIHANNALERKKCEVQKNYKNQLEAQFPGLNVHILYTGEMSADAISHYIELHHIDYVFSCLGMKTQESSLVDIFTYLPSYLKVVGLGVWASIDFLLGVQTRSPKLFQDLGLEWLYRLVTQPRIRSRRIWDAVVEFPRVVRDSLR